MKEVIKQRLSECRLELNESKTKIVYCKDTNRRGSYDHVKFDFLGYTFQPRKAFNNRGECFLSFLPAISAKACKRIGQTMRAWWKTSRTDKSLEERAVMITPTLRGWINYYGKFYKSKLYKLLARVNDRLSIWVTKKYKRFRGHRRRARLWLGEISKTSPQLFAHWSFGIKPSQKIVRTG